MFPKQLRANSTLNIIHPRYFQLPVVLDQAPGFRALVINSMKPDIGGGGGGRASEGPVNELRLVNIKHC